eukprot:3156718-Heterocapsa_arctica.AAC.1
MFFVLLPKPKGGMRPIALFCSLFRLWSRVRRSEAAELYEANDDDFFACGKGRGAETYVWRQAVKAEAGVAQGGRAAT